MNTSASVLIYGASQDSCDVLSELLAREGIGAAVASRAEQAGRMLQDKAPELVLIDADSAPAETEADLESLERRAARNGAPIVVLGTKRGASRFAGAGEFVRKPYHYGPLIHRICESVAQSRRNMRRAA